MIIDRNGKVRYNAFRIEAAAAKKLLDRLRTEKAPNPKESGEAKKPASQPEGG